MGDMTPQEQFNILNKYARPSDVVQSHDIIQITDDQHPWYPALLIVDEIKPWGVQACCLVPQNNNDPSSCAQAYNRLKEGTYEYVGRARVVPA